mgnify:CR=1 FL=1
MDHDEKAVKMEPIQAAQALDFSLMALFARASLTVQVVMVLLIVASVWAWAIIIQKFMVFAKARREAARFDRAFWSGEPLDDLYDRLGVDLIKTGYVADAGNIISCNADIKDPCGAGEVFEWHDGQRQVQHHLRVVETAARHRIAINPHEPVKDTGLRRTYPNWITREGQRGMEYNAWGEPKNPPHYDTELVFTRMLEGPMDFTPGILSLKGQNDSDERRSRRRGSRGTVPSTSRACIQVSRALSRR